MKKNCAQDGLPEIISILGVNSVIMYDDNYNAYNQFAQDTLKDLPGKIRCFLPASTLSLFVPVHILVLVPPYYEELHFAMDANKDHEIDLHCWLQHKELFVDLADLIRSNKKDEYNKLISEYHSHSISYKNYGNDDTYSIMTKNFVKHLVSPILVLPFETRQWHHTVYKDEIKNDQIKLFSPVDNFSDKVNAAKLITAIYPELLPNYTNPRSINIYSSQETKPLSVNKVNSELLAKRIITECVKIEEEGKKSYIKLDAQGLEGLDNLSPQIYSSIYMGPIKERIENLSKLLIDRFSTYEYFPSIPMIEERIEKSKDKFGVKEYIASGVFDTKRWNLWSLTRAITDTSGKYIGAIGSSSLTKLGISNSEYQSIVEIMEKTALAMKNHGYQMGYVSKDIMLDARDGFFKIHDHNDRRGGRSFLEQLIHHYPEHIFVEKVIHLDFDEDVDTIKFIQKAYNEPFQNNQFYCIYRTSTLYQSTSPVKVQVVASIPDQIIQDAAILDYIDQIEEHTQLLYNKSK